MTQTVDLLVLAVSRVRKGLALAGMTTEPHPITGHVWVDLVRADGPLSLADITLDDGALIRPGDVVRWTDLTPVADEEPSERLALSPSSERTLLRHITPERYARFVPEHVDKDPAAVLERQERSLALIKPNEASALFELDEPRYKSYLLFQVAELGTFDVPVVDLVWRALGRTWLAEHEEEALEIEDILGHVGQVYLVIGRHTNGTPLVRGVLGIPELSAAIDPRKL